MIEGLGILILISVTATLIYSVFWVADLFRNQSQFKGD